jgi:hypothetical protein
MRRRSRATRKVGVGQFIRMEQIGGRETDVDQLLVVQLKSNRVREKLTVYGASASTCSESIVICDDREVARAATDGRVESLGRDGGGLAGEGWRGMRLVRNGERVGETGHQPAAVRCVHCYSLSCSVLKMTPTI